MAEDYNESTRVMPVGGEAPIDRTMVATAAPPAGATQMGTTLACPVCRTTNPGLETYCVECGFLLTSTPGELNAAIDEGTEALELVESASGRRFRLRDGVNTVGRENSDILLLDGTVSRRHAEVRVDGGSVTVTDLGSTNGTQVDGSRLGPNEPTPIAPGALVRFGNAMLTLPGTADSAVSEPAEATIITGSPSIDQTLIATAPALTETLSDAEVESLEGAPVSVSGAVARLMGTAGAADILLRPGALTIGRRPGNDIVLPDAFVSGRHVEVICDDAGCRLTDLGSTNGTSVNGLRLEANQPQAVVDGDEVQIGQSTYRFEALRFADPDAREAEESTPGDEHLSSVDEEVSE